MFAYACRLHRMCTLAGGVFVELQLGSILKVASCLLVAESCENLVNAEVLFMRMRLGA